MRRRLTWSRKLIDGTGSSRRGIGDSALGRIDTEHERSADAGGRPHLGPVRVPQVSAEVGGVHSTVEAGESRWREGTLVLGAFEGEESQETGLCPISSATSSESPEKLYVWAKDFLFACPYVKPVREPDALAAHVRFDEREVETDLTDVISSSRVRQPR